jgi:hypothetical protein
MLCEVDSSRGFRVISLDGLIIMSGPWKFTTDFELNEELMSFGTIIFF